jgi:hypothetical protein
MIKQTLAVALALFAPGVITGLAVAQGAQQQSTQRRPTSGGTVQPATTLICKRPAMLAHTAGVDRCHGDWHFADNTNNWTYQAAQGPDHFTRSNGKAGGRSCTTCPNGGNIKEDFQGVQDWCVKWVPAVTAATATPSCPAGYSWTGNICTRPGTPEQVLHVYDRCHGDWHPTDNTNNWTYRAVQGPDHFTRSNGTKGDRSCTKCPNGGRIRQNFQGQEDWCLDYVPAVTAATTGGICPSTYTLGPP